MKKSLLALAVLGAFAGAASAQSSVTLYGTVDLSGKYVKNDGYAKRLSLARDGINSSQLGFRGVEDLGGGLKAGFTLLSSVGADSGDIGAGQSATGSGKFFTRRSTLSLFSGAGELRLGRDYTPTFWNDTIFDAFGTNGLGDSTHVQQLPTSTFVRADNSIGYFLPSNLGGLYGQAMVAAAENCNTQSATVCSSTAAAGQTSNAGRYIGGRVGFAAGPFDVAIAGGSQRTAGYQGGDQRTYNIGGAWDFGFLKLLGYLDHDQTDGLRENRGSISGVIPMGQGEVHLGYDRSKLKNYQSATNTYENTVWQAKGTYQYNLSKRTAMYGTVSIVKNGDHSVNAVAAGTSVTHAPNLGGDSKGFELGVRHFF